MKNLATKISEEPKFEVIRWQMAIRLRSLLRSPAVGALEEAAFGESFALLSAALEVRAEQGCVFFLGLESFLKG